MTGYRWTPEDLALHQQAKELGKPANLVAKGSSYETNKDEQQEQIWFIEWCQAQWVSLVDLDGDPFDIRLDVATEGSTGGAFLSGDDARRRLQGGVMRAMGHRAGTPDITIFIAVGHFRGLRLEMKKRRDQFKCSSDIARAVSGEQVARLTLMRRLGWATGTPFGWIEAAQQTCTYLQWVHEEHGVDRPHNGSA